MRLIDADYLIKRLDKCDQLNGIGLEPVMAMRDIKALISVIPKVDAAPVKHGKWFDTMVGAVHVHVCDQCNAFFPLTYIGGKHYYCPNCGARMDLEEQDAGQRADKNWL